MNVHSIVTMLTQGASMGSLEASNPRGLAWLSLEIGLQGEGGGIMAQQQSSGLGVKSLGSSQPFWDSVSSSIKWAISLPLDAAILPTFLGHLQEMTLHMDITRQSIPKSGWLYSLQPKMEKLYTVSKNKTGSWLWLRSWNPYYQIQT